MHSKLLEQTPPQTSANQFYRRGWRNPKQSMLKYLSMEHYSTVATTWVDCPMSIVLLHSISPRSAAAVDLKWHDQMKPTILTRYFHMQLEYLLYAKYYK